MGYNILIVDDSATTRAIIRRTVSMSDVQVDQFHEAEHGKAALEKLAANNIDLVLADLNMPEMDGREMTRLILTNPATQKVPVVLVTANPNLQQLKQLVADGAKGYLRKPFTPEAMRDIVTRVLGNDISSGELHA